MVALALALALAFVAHDMYNLLTRLFKGAFYTKLCTVDFLLGTSGVRVLPMFNLKLFLYLV
jgi:hypothetical protein